MNQRPLEEAHWSCLRRYGGLRVNLFLAMNTPGMFLAADHTALAVRDGDYALTAAVSFDPVFGYFYVQECHWYRRDLSPAADDDVPDAVRHSLLRRFHAVVG